MQLRHLQRQLLLVACVVCVVLPLDISTREKAV
jgi:hypothetical protein